MKFTSIIALIGACNTIRIGNNQLPTDHDCATDDYPANPDGTYGPPPIPGTYGGDYGDYGDESGPDYYGPAGPGNYNDYGDYGGEQDDWNPPNPIDEIFE
jgi:hypothetical protein